MVWTVSRTIGTRSQQKPAVAHGRSLCWQSARASSIQLAPPHLGDAAGRPDVALAHLREGAAAGDARQRRRHHACGTEPLKTRSTRQQSSACVLHVKESVARQMHPSRSHVNAPLSLLQGFSDNEIAGIPDASGAALCKDDCLQCVALKLYRRLMATHCVPVYIASADVRRPNMQMPMAGSS
jgi:hypothetical protein